MQLNSQLSEPHSVLEQASRSSAPSAQSGVPSQSRLFSMHLGAAADADFDLESEEAPESGQLNLFSGHVMAVQLRSSVPSVQSL